MNGQGTQIVNTALFDSLIAKINAAKNAVDLTRYVDQVMEPVHAQLSYVQAEIDRLAPFLALLNPPTTDPIKIVEWITKLIGLNIQPQVQAYYSYVSQIALLTAKVTQLEAAIRSAEQKFEGLSLPLPEIPTVTVPDITG
jgi:hypothetical protein